MTSSELGRGDVELRRRDAQGQQRFDVGEAFGFRYLGEDMAQLGVKLGTIGLGCPGQRVQICAALGDGHGIGEQPAAPSDAERADGTLHAIGVTS